MGWKGALRTYAAIQRREVRAELREARAAARDARENQRRQEQELAEELVARFDLQLKLLGTVHHDCSAPIDWNAVARCPKPELVQPHQRTAAAKAALEGYRPGFFDRLFGGEKRKRAALMHALAEAQRADNEEVRLFEQSCEDWDKGRRVAEAILAGDATRYADALDGVDAFDELEERAASISINASNSALLTVDVVLPAAEVVVPDEQHSVTQRGKLSTKNLPKARRHEIYQDYVCGAALRAAREVLAALPVSVVHVTVRCPLTDAATGHTNVTPVLSVIIPRSKAATLNYQAVDPSEAMSNFVHRMGFKKTAGMKPIEPLTEADAG